MKWGNNRQSDQVEDRRSSSGGGMFGGGGRRTGGRNIGLGTIVIALIGGWIFGINPMTILSFLGGAGDLAPSQTQNAPASAPAGKPTDEMGQFVAAVLGGTEDVWMTVFQQSGSQYQKPRLVLFRGAVPTACGTGQSAMGPFYCPGDQKVYIDLSFYDTLRRQLGAPGDFAQAYVIAHEVGHHVQNLLGIHKKVAQLRQHLADALPALRGLQAELQGIAGELAPLAVRLAKESLLKAMDTDLASGLRFERHAFTVLAATDDRREGISAFREKRTPVIEGRLLCGVRRSIRGGRARRDPPRRASLSQAACGRSAPAVRGAR